MFQGGGSKDPQEISGWAWKDEAGGPPDKDNLVHAFAARYSLTPDNDGTDGTLCPADTAATCELLYFGSDRFANDGDARQGLWFLQNQVRLSDNKVGGALGFSGLHRLGDLLIISDFSNGGTTSTITVFRWNPACTATNKSDGTIDKGKCADANLETLALQEANCGSGTLPPGDPFCGIVNGSDGTPTPWSGDYTDKSGNHSYLQGEFFEAGINLSLFGFANECFSTVVAETRSSTSTTATLKDFVIGQFTVCGASLKTVRSQSTFEIGGSVTDAATVSVTGGATPPASTGEVKFFVCGTPATSCATTGTPFDTKPLSGAVQSGTDYTVTSASYTPTSAGTYCFAASWPGDLNYRPDSPATEFRDNGMNECFTVTPRTPTIFTTQTPTTDQPLGTATSDTATIGNTAPQAERLAGQRDGPVQAVRAEGYSGHCELHGEPGVHVGGLHRQRQRDLPDGAAGRGDVHADAGGDVRLAGDVQWRSAEHVRADQLDVR